MITSDTKQNGRQQAQNASTSLPVFLRNTSRHCLRMLCVLQLPLLVCSHSARVGLGLSQTLQSDSNLLQVSVGPYLSLSRQKHLRLRLTRSLSPGQVTGRRRPQGTEWTQHRSECRVPLIRAKLQLGGAAAGTPSGAPPWPHWTSPTMDAEPEEPSPPLSISGWKGVGCELKSEPRTMPKSHNTSFQSALKHPGQLEGTRPWPPHLR